jgi:hypothetical protein
MSLPTEPEAPSPGTPDRARDLVFAIAHEIGNHLGGIRLHAHLLDAELSAREVADSSVSIDHLASRSGPLLALLRPLLADQWETTTETSWQGVVSHVTQQIEGQGTLGVEFEVRAEISDSVAAPRFDWLHALLVAVVESTLAETGRGDFVRLTVTHEGDETVLVLEDNGPEEDVSPGAAYRARPLCLALARELVGRAGGRVGAERVANLTRVQFNFPT